MTYFKIFLLLLCTHLLNGQDLAFWADAMINSSKSEHRLMAAKSFQEDFRASLNEPDSFKDKYKELEWISIQYPQDSSFRLISWQLKEGVGQYHYYGFYQDANSLISFGTEHDSDGIDEEALIMLNEWSGALVYRVLEMDGEYMLWTFRYLDQFNKVKTCEPLVINNGQVTLGKPIFQEKEDSSNFFSRLILQYSADMNATLDFNSDNNHIIYDNLILVGGRMEGQGMTYVADGSYRAYSYENEKWRAVDKVFDQVSEQAPRVRSKKSSKDLFGRKGN